MEQKLIYKLVEYLSNNLHISFNKRNSFKIYENEKYEDNRVIFCFAKIKEEYIPEIINEVYESNKAINYLTRRFMDGNSFFISFSPNLVKLYIEKEVSFVDSCCYVQINLLSDDIIYGSYKHCPYNGQYMDKLLPIKEHLKLGFRVARTDGQIYYKFKDYANIQIISQNLINLIPHIAFIEWLNLQIGSPTWVQVSEKSITIYCSSY